jgi:hypothetical protein
MYKMLIVQLSAPHKNVIWKQGFKSPAKAFSGGAAKMVFSGL